MGIFTKAKENGYVKNLETITKVNLSLLETMSDMQKEYEAVVAENNALKAELTKMKERRGI